MSLNDIPTEILERIFTKLSTADLASCEQVCRRWGAGAGSVLEARWRRACVRDFPEAYKEARRKSQYKLSWQELHRSLSLWPHIASARQEVYSSDPIDSREDRICLRESPRHFTVLNNGLISIPVYTRKGDDIFLGDWNSVLYLEIDTLSEHHTQPYNFKFDSYEENDDMAVFRGRYPNVEGSKLIIGTKENGVVNKLFTVGDMMQYMWGDDSNFILVNNSVYYRDKDNMICVAKLTQTDAGTAAVVNKRLAHFDDERGGRVDFKMAAIAEVSEELVHVLTDRGQVYAASKGQYVYRGRIKKNMNNRDEVIDKLTSYGFDWSSPRVFRWVNKSDIIEGDWVAITRTKRAILHRQARVVLLATIIRTLHIYYDPYNKRTGKLNLYNAKPRRKIDLRDYFDSDERMPSEMKRVSQLDVVETHDGHKVIAMMAGEIVVIELTHTARDGDGEPASKVARLG